MADTKEQNPGLFKRLSHAFTRMADEQPVSVADYEDASGVGVSIDKLNKSFNGNHVLQDIDLEIKPGETFSIIGPSGTGKSVLLKHIVNLIKPDSGRILIDGIDLDKTSTTQNKRFSYSMVFQTSALFN